MSGTRSQPTSSASGQAPETPKTKPVVLHLGPDPLGRGGMSSVLQTLLSSRLAQSYELRAISTHPAGRRASRIGIFVRALVQLRKILRSPQTPQIVHVHTAARGSMYRKALIVALARRYGAVVILHLHTGSGEMSEFWDGLGPARRRFFKRALEGADVLLSASDATAREVASRFGTQMPTVLNNPLPGPLPREPSNDATQAAPELLYLGGFEAPVKGGQVLLEALAGLGDVSSTFGVTLAGPGQAPPGADAVGRWVGWLEGSAKAQALERADIVVLPSISEGLPVALLEAMSYGKAVIATSVGSIPKVIADGVNGVLVPSGDPAALAAGIRRLLAEPQLRRDLGASARLRAAEFTPERIAEQLDVIYQKALKAN